MPWKDSRPEEIIAKHSWQRACGSKRRCRRAHDGIGGRELGVRRHHRERRTRRNRSNAVERRALPRTKLGSRGAACRVRRGGAAETHREAWRHGQRVLDPGFWVCVVHLGRRTCSGWCVQSPWVGGDPKRLPHRELQASCARWFAV